MRIIQSFWGGSQTNLLTNNSGWVSPEYNLMSRTLSCLQLSKFYNDIVFYGDSPSAKLFIDVLQLPYTNVVCNMNWLDKYPKQAWALAKIYAYSLQDSPFLHIDGDVFIWKTFDKKLIEGRLIAQNKEVGSVHYEALINALEKNLVYFPEDLTYQRKKDNKIYAYNAGILGGNDPIFYKEYANQAFEFIDNNMECMPKIDIGFFNVVFEQYLFYCLAEKQQIKVNVQIDNLITDDKYIGFGDFTSVPYNKYFLHLLGTYKKNKNICNQMASRLRQDYPEYYYRIISLFKNAEVPLFKDYYYFTDCCSESKFLERHDTLKKGYYNGNCQKLATDTDTIAHVQINKCNSTQVIDTAQEKDLSEFYNRLQTINNDRFVNISKDYLYGRDLNATQYCQYMFEETKSIYEKAIVADDIIEIIESQFNWIEEINGKQKYSAPEIEDESVSVYYTAIVPECDKTGFSVDNLDELDILMLESLKEELTIAGLFSIIKNSFDAEELESSKDEFEKLIFGRVKKGLVNKTLKCILPAK